MRSIVRGIFMNTDLRLFAIMLFAAFGLSCWMPTAVAGVVEVEVQAHGFGTTLRNALDDALLSAVEQVVGKQLAQESLSQLGSLSLSDENDSLHLSSDAFSQQVVTASRGIVCSYSILTSGRDADGQWEVSVQAVIAKYVLESPSGQMRVVVAPFGASKSAYRVGERDAAHGTVIASIKRALEVRLNEVAQYDVITRDFARQVYVERSMLEGGRVPTVELARMCQDLPAEYLLVGFLDEYAIEVENRVSRQGTPYSVVLPRIDLTWNLIDVATQRQLDAGEIHLGDRDFDEGRFDDLGSTESALSLLSQNLADKMLEQVVRKMPIPVLDADDREKEVAIGVGDALAGAGDIYAIYWLGVELSNPEDPGTARGKAETLAGKIELTRATHNKSFGRVLSDKVSLETAMQKGVMIARLEKSAKPVRPSREEEREELKSDIKKKIDGLW